MTSMMPKHTSIADLTLKLPVEVHYGNDDSGSARITSVKVVVGREALEVLTLLSEEDFFDLFVQLEAYYNVVN
jgi:hypothetical protein